MSFERGGFQYVAAKLVCLQSSYEPIPLHSLKPTHIALPTVLVNEHTASASEILAGAIKDNCRGVLVGKRTYGKVRGCGCCVG